MNRSKLELSSAYGKDRQDTEESEPVNRQPRERERPVHKPYKRTRVAWVYGIGWVVRDARTGMAWY